MKSGRIRRQPRPILRKREPSNQNRVEMYADPNSTSSSSSGSGGSSSPGESLPIPTDEAQFQKTLDETWSDCWDFQTRVLEGPNQVRIVIAWLKVMVDTKLLIEGIIRPLQNVLSDSLSGPTISPSDVRRALTLPCEKALTSMSDVQDAIANGLTVVYVKGSSQALCVDVKHVEGRQVDVSEGEPTIQGPQAAFVEQLDINVGQVRRIIRDPRLKVRAARFGSVSRTQLATLYIEGISKNSYIEELNRRLKNVDVDLVVDSEIIVELIRDSAWSPFPVVEKTERPDKVASALTQGRIVIMVDGTPEALIAPTVFAGLLTSAEDYYGSYILSPLLRIMRHLLFWAALTLPSLYISLLTYNQDLVPTPLLINLEAQHEGIPFPTVLEALIMQFSFEALREAGVRLPRAVGQSVSIVGALVIGEAAVTAGLVSPGMVIVVSATGVASFTIPDYTLVNAVRVLQLGFFFSAATLGLYGMVVFGIVLVLHMVSLRSLGVPYMSPIAPLDAGSLGDVFIRAPYSMMHNRPKIYEPKDPTRSRSKFPSPTFGGRKGAR